MAGTALLRLRTGRLGSRPAREGAAVSAPL